MSTLLMKKAAGYMATASLIACPFISSVAVAMPTQTAFTTTSLSSTESVKLTNNPVLVRHTTNKPESTLVTSPAKEPKQQDKKAIGRCWKRLMNMVREVSHAHHTKSKVTG